jgi:hypothetical protein
MTEKGEPKIVGGQAKDWTKVTFKPDLPRFGMTELTVDTIALMKKRVYDMAGCCPGVKVFLNGTRLPVRNFRNYIELYTKKTPPPAAPSENGDGVPLPSAPPKEVPILLVDVCVISFSSATDHSRSLYRATSGGRLVLASASRASSRSLS